MVLPKLKIAAHVLAATVAVTGAGSLVQQVLAHKPPPSGVAEQKSPSATVEKTPRASKLDLTPQSMAQLRDLVRPADHEWRHLKVKWFTDIVAARKKAAKEDKPIFVFRTGGAGYNDPLGVC